MKIVIDIPEKYLNSYIIDVTLITGVNNTITDVNVEDKYAEFQVLPKGHGDLIDSHDLETRKFIGVEEHKTLKTDDELSAYQSGWNTAVDEIIKYAPTVIPADN